MRGSDLNSELLFTQVSHSLATDFMPIVINWACICQTMSNNQWMIVIDHTGNHQGKGVKYCLIRLRSSVLILIYWFFVNIEHADQHLNMILIGREMPQILGAIGHPCYNEFSVLTNFVLTGFHWISFLILAKLPCVLVTLRNKAFYYIAVNFVAQIQM